MTIAPSISDPNKFFIFRNNGQEIEVNINSKNNTSASGYVLQYSYNYELTEDEKKEINKLVLKNKSEINLV